MNKADIYLFFSVLNCQLRPNLRQEKQKTREGRDEWEAEVGAGEEAVRRDMLEDGKEGKQKRI